jgi:hypothetical protein
LREKYPLFSYLAMIVLGLVPTALVTYYYGDLPNRMVIQWDTLGRMTVIGTRASTVLMVANFAAVAGIAGSVLAFALHRSFVAIDGLRAFVMLNMAQIVAINLTCVMIVTESIGYNLTIKPMIPPAMSLLLFSGGVLLWRVEQGKVMGVGRFCGAALMIAGVGLLMISALLAHQIVGYYASAFAVLMMIAAALPSQRQ